MSLQQIVAQVNTYGARHIVLTGGEPMIAPGVVELAEALQREKHHITIETAGTVWADLRCDLMSISPKLSNSTPFEREGGRWAAQHDRLRYQPDVLRKLTGAYAHQLKFVVSSPADLDEIAAICNAIDADPSNVMLMPEGITRQAIAERSLWLVNICKETGYRLSPRLHIDLWGDKRGV